MSFKLLSFKSLKGSASRNVLLTFVVAAIIPSVAMAQSKVPVFAPASGWEVNAGQLSNVRGLKSMKLPCVLSTEYDNGFVVRFSGGGNQMMALAVDFRQDVFKQGRQYDAMLSIGSGYVQNVKATAFSQSTLIFNLRPLSGFYNAAQNGGEMEIDIDGNVLKFALGRIGASYPQLENCYNGGDAAPVKPITTQTASKAPVAAVESEAVVADSTRNLPRSFDEIVRGSSADAAPTQLTPEPVVAAPHAVTAMAGRVSRADPDASASVPQRPVNIARSAAPVAAVPAAPSAAPSVLWEARAGEDMRIVLSRWAERAGYDLQWQSDQGGKVAQDLKLSGNFEEAVGQLLAENSAATGIGAHVETQQGGKRDIGPSVSRAASVAPPQQTSAPVQASIPAMHTQWVAAPGANIQAILDQWSSKAGVAIVWQSYMSVPVKHPVRVDGTYEQAVQTLLDQYMNDPRRPIGQLNIDPDSGVKTLLMDISG